jgi:3-hydroxybutyryl-CoA dehydrogenase
VTNTPFQKIGILGSGTMGAGIAQICLQAGYSVRLYDLEASLTEAACQRIQDGLEKAVQKDALSAQKRDESIDRLSTHTAMADLADCDLIIEAAPEDLELKHRLFAELDALCAPETILASNTSSLSITALGGTSARAPKIAGLHFFNPVPVMRLVEVIRGKRTTDETMNRLVAFAQTLGKKPVKAQDTPGFIVNRVARPFYGEALKILGEHGNSSEMMETIDTVMKDVGGFRMGPFALMDLIGIDVNLAVTQSVWNAYFQLSRYRPHPIQQRMVHAGLLGRKTGEGFYKYES